MNAPRKHSWFALGVLVTTSLAILWWPLTHPNLFGSHDWDSLASHRYVVAKTLLRFGQFPFWNPYNCGGHPSWGGAESGVLVNPFSLGFLALPLPLAIRFEIVATLAFGLWGMWKLAARYVHSPLLRAVVCLLGFLNSRWALQMGAGHIWHLYYALFPWGILCALSLFALVQRRSPAAVYSGLALAALMALGVYAGAIYPTPHLALSFLLLAGLRAGRTRSVRPLLAAASVGVLALLLAAPKLLPLLDVMRRFPRTIKSTETYDPIDLWHMLTSTFGARAQHPVEGLDYGFHEYGLRVTVLGLAFLLVGLWFARKRGSLRDLYVAGLVLFWCSEAPISPWRILHMIPVFASQHVTTRFMYPALILLTVVASSGVERALRRWDFTYRTPLLASVTLYLGAAMGIEGYQVVRARFVLELPDMTDVIGDFQQFRTAPPSHIYAQDQAKRDSDLNGSSALMPQLRNVGVLDCKTFPNLGADDPDQCNGHPCAQGARGADEPSYRGEVFIEDGDSGGHASITGWTPNRVDVEVVGARPGSRIVLNQNWESSWRANDVPTLDVGARIVHVLRAEDFQGSTARVQFRYVPRTFALGCGLFVVAVLVAVGSWLFVARSRRLRSRGM